MAKAKAAAIIIVLMTTCILAQNTSDRSTMDQEHEHWIQHVMQVVAKIQPGMTRGDLSHSFEEDGGMQFQSQGRYVFKHCRYIKIDVRFSSVDNLDFSPDDKIIEVSRPYLEYPTSD